MQDYILETDVLYGLRIATLCEHNSIHLKRSGGERRTHLKGDYIYVVDIEIYT